jgi:hypothetical protein
MQNLFAPNKKHLPAAAAMGWIAAVHWQGFKFSIVKFDGFLRANRSCDLSLR